MEILYTRPSQACSRRWSSGDFFLEPRSSGIACHSIVDPPASTCGCCIRGRIIVGINVVFLFFAASNLTFRDWRLVWGGFLGGLGATLVIEKFVGLACPVVIPDTRCLQDARYLGNEAGLL